MADAENPAAMRVSAQCLRCFNGIETRDQAHDFRGADIERRQDGGFTRGERTHTRRLDSCPRAFRFGFWRQRSGTFGRGVFRQADKHPARNTQVDRQDVLVEDVILALESREFGNCGGSADFRQCDFDLIVDLQCPATLRDETPALIRVRRSPAASRSATYSSSRALAPAPTTSGSAAKR